MLVLIQFMKTAGCRAIYQSAGLSSSKPSQSPRILRIFLILVTAAPYNPVKCNSSNCTISTRNAQDRTSLNLDEFMLCPALVENIFKGNTLQWIQQHHDKGL